MTKIKAAVLDKPNVLGIKEIEMPKPGPGEVLVKVKAVGICGSDVHYYIEGRIGDYIVEKPIILGHETSGEIAEVGPGVTHLKKGDKVALPVSSARAATTTFAPTLNSTLRRPTTALSRSTSCTRRSSRSSCPNMFPSQKAR
jgi:threonine dehydrogenase-like Zn-dependent dehydrogenase